MQAQFAVLEQLVRQQQAQIEALTNEARKKTRKHQPDAGEDCKKADNGERKS